MATTLSDPLAPPPVPDPTTAAEVEGLYVHVPFCFRKCSYCDFYSVATGRRAPDAQRFLEALDRELASLPPSFAPRTIFVGGGTPTELSPPDFARLLARIRERVRLDRLEEWSCEANPQSLHAAHLEAAREAGVDRISLGVQSFDDRVLRWLGRIHDAADAHAAVERVRAAGFERLNIDLISAVPVASPDRLAADLRTAIALQPEHISCYTLMFEEGTPLDALRRKGAVRPLDEERELAEFEATRARLTAAGYRHYEISAFCRTETTRDLRCRHNLLYWSGGQYFGVGPGAWSHVDRWRYGNVRDVARWQAALLETDAPEAAHRQRLDAWERLDPEPWAREVLVMWLRQLDGVPHAAFEARTGFPIESLYPAGERGSLSRLLAHGWLEDDGTRLRLTERGLPIADAVFAELI